MLEVNLSIEPIRDIVSLLSVALLLSLLPCVIQLAQWKKRAIISRGLDVITKILLSGLAAFQVIAWRLFFYRESHDAVELWGIGLALMSGLVVWSVASIRPSETHPRLAKCLPGLLALLSLIELAGFAKVTELFAMYTPEPPHPAKLLNDLTVDTVNMAVTDKGTSINLYQRLATDEDFKWYIDNGRADLQRSAEKAILRAKPYLQANCHGWVFTEGKHIVRSEDVPTILDQNGYSQTDAPRLNDVAVYRNSEGQVTHTGVVRGFVNDDAPLVESKWGAEGIYLHLAEEQPYGQNISYWRNARGTHSLRIIRRLHAKLDLKTLEQLAQQCRSAANQF